MRSTTLRPMLLCFVLLGAFGQAAATEARQMGPNGDGACPSDTTASNRDADDDTQPASTPAARAASVKASKPAARGSGNRTTAPRWHSFLPGMFR